MVDILPPRGMLSGRPISTVRLVHRFHFTSSSHFPVSVAVTKSSHPPLIRFFQFAMSKPVVFNSFGTGGLTQPSRWRCSPRGNSVHLNSPGNGYATPYSVGGGITPGMYDEGPGNGSLHGSPPPARRFTRSRPAWSSPSLSPT